MSFLRTSLLVLNSFICFSFQSSYVKESSSFRNSSADAMATCTAAHCFCLQLLDVPDLQDVPAMKYTGNIGFCMVSAAGILQTLNITGSTSQPLL